MQRKPLYLVFAQVRVENKKKLTLRWEILHRGDNQYEAVRVYKEAYESNDYFSVILVEQIRPIVREWEESKEEPQAIYKREEIDPYDDDTAPYF